MPNGSVPAGIAAERGGRKLTVAVVESPGNSETSAGSTTVQSAGVPTISNR